MCVPSFAAPPEATAYQITVDHAGVTTSGGALALQETPLWSVDFPSPSSVSYPVIAGRALIPGGAVYVTVAGTPGDLTLGTTLYAFNPQSGNALWPPVAVPDTVGDWSNLTYDAGKLFVLSADGTLRSFDAVTGAPGNWPAPVSVGNSYSPPTASNGVVYVSGIMRALRESDGSQIWVESLGPTTYGDHSSPAVGPNGVYVSYSCPHVYAFDLSAGTSQWIFPQTSNCSGGGGKNPVYANGHLYVRDVVGSDASGFPTHPQGYILDTTNNGTQVGSFPYGPAPAITATTGFFLQTGPPAVLNAVDLATNTTLWSFSGDGLLTTAPIVVDDEVIVGSSNCCTNGATLWALDAVTGTVVWKQRLNDVMVSAPDEQSGGRPLTGLAVADGVLVVPLDTQQGPARLVAYSIFGPPGPTGLVATGEAGAVQLDWTAASPAASYEIYMGTATRTEGLTPVQTGLNTTTATVTGLTPGTTYYFKVKARTAGGISAPSNEVSATPGNAAGTSNLVATAGAASVALTWSTSVGADSYNVYAGTAAGGESATPVATGITAGTYTINGLTPGTTYYYIVKTVSGGVVGAASNETSATPSTMPPTNLTATAGAGEVSLSWSAASGAASYTVYQGTASGSESGTPVATGVSATSVDITGLTAGTTYYFVVKAAANSTMSGASNETSATPQSPPPQPPQPPANLTASAGVGKVSLSWSAVAAATSYNVYEGTASGSESGTPVASGVSVTSTDITGLTAGTTYYFVVKAVSGGGVSGASNEISATPQAAPPAAPANLTATAGIGKVSLSWSAVAAATSYNVYQGTATGSESGTPVQTGVSATSIDITGLAAGTTYYFVVKAVSSGGVGGPSNEISATPQAQPTPSTGGGGGGALGWSSLACLMALTTCAASRRTHRVTGRRMAMTV
jgi:fibronectin type 3 domain-containing protein